MNFDNTAQVEALAKLPPEPPKPLAPRSAWSIPHRVLQSTVAGVAASVADVVKGAAAADAMTLGADPRARATFTPEQLRAGEDEGRRQIATGEALTSDIGESLRQVQRDARPDPATASTAEQLVFGAAEPIIKLVGGALTLGPVGLGMASAEIGFQQSDDLRRQGVDFNTRTGVGILTAGVTAASAALPLAGQTLKGTAGLYALGGPGGFMAQQAATSAILEHAGYDKIAQQFDPLDPLGLAVSALVPLPFAAWGARNVIRSRKPVVTETVGGNKITATQDEIDAVKGYTDVPLKPLEPVDLPATVEVPPEVVDAAMVHNLTLLRDMQERTPVAAGVAEMLRGPVTENPNFKAWFGDSKVVDGEGRPSIMYRGTANEDASAYPGAMVFLTQDPAFASLYSNKDGGAVFPVYVRAENVIDASRGKGFALWKRFVDETNAPDYAAQGTDRGKLPGWQNVHLFQEWLDAKGIPYDGIWVGESNRTASLAVRDVAQLKSAIGNSGAFDPNSASLTDPVPVAAADPAPAKPPATPAQQLAESLAQSDDPNVRSVAAALKAVDEAIGPEQADALVKAAQAYTKAADSGQPLAQAIEGMGLPPEVNNLLVGIAENVRLPARLEALARELAKQAEQFKSDPANATADAVETVRALTDAQLTQTEPKTIAAKADPLMQSVQERVAAVEIAAPDMVIGLDKDGNPITVSDELARIRREAMEGTDVELGAKDAELVNVAANCALSTGGA